MAQPELPNIAAADLVTFCPLYAEAEAAENGRCGGQ